MLDTDPIPDLFPGSLLSLCLDKVLQLLLKTGDRVETEAVATSQYHRERRYSGSIYEDIYLEPSLITKAWPHWLTHQPNQTHFTGTKVFLQSSHLCREFLSLLLAGPVLDSLTEEARKIADPKESGHTFTFTVLCGDRLGKLVLHHHMEILEDRCRNWANFVSSPSGSALTMSCLSQLASLSCLYLQHIATNDMLYVLAQSCTRLLTLDISYSKKVTDIGLVHLCGMLRGPPTGSSGLTAGLPPPPRGCRYLRELYFNPHSTEDQEPIMPKVIACLLRHLPMLQVADLANLHLGIEHYYRRSGGESTQRQARVKPLNLIHYTGSDRLAEVMDVCPKLRTFKLFVTEELPDLGYTLQSLNHRLDQVTLVYSQNHTSLNGFQEFLSACGRRISRLEVEGHHDLTICPADLTSIASSCMSLESLWFSHFHVLPEVDPRVSHCPVPVKPANFPFLQSVRFSNVQIDEFGKDVFRYLLGGAHDLESIVVSFHASGYFFSDFLLDDILLMNELAHLTEFIVKDGALTLISALRLISSKPKLKTIGKLKNWDVEVSELDTFVQILRKAKSLNLLHDINII